jgi:hypothetical protein
MVTRVEIINSVQAICPIRFAFGSGDLKYFAPGHLVTKIKQIIGKITEKKYIRACVLAVVESGAEFSFSPQFGQK